MTIYDEQLIPILCNSHLLQGYKDSWLLYKRLKKNNRQFSRAMLEFMDSPLELAYRMNVLFQEIKKRKLRMHRIPLQPFDISEEPLIQALRERKAYVSLQSLAQQKKLLRKECRTCKV